jgi:hypothetical protein
VVLLNGTTEQLQELERRRLFDGADRRANGLRLCGWGTLVSQTWLRRFKVVIGSACLCRHGVSQLETREIAGGPVLLVICGLARPDGTVKEPNGTRLPAFAWGNKQAVPRPDPQR